MIDSVLKNKKLAAATSVVSNLSLIVMKLITGFITGSVSILSEAIHSSSDFLASIITLFAVHKAEEPADNDHQFGHGKYEDVAGFVEGCLILLASFYIIYEAGRKLLGVSDPMNNSLAGIIVMLISVITNILVSSYLFKVAETTDSIAIYSDAEHLRTDIFSSLTVFAGLIVIRYTGLHIIDSIIALIVSMIIMHTGYKICKDAMNNILDGSLPQNDIDVVKSIINEYQNHGIDSIKQIKTRKSGKDKEIIIILLVNGEMTVRFTHNLCDELENKIEQNIGNTKITIHIEPSEQLLSSCPDYDKKVK